MATAQDVAARFVEAFNAHDEEAIRAVNGENVVFEGPGDVHLEGRDLVTQYATEWLNAFPDARLVVHNEIVAGDWVVQEATFEGTHTGPLQSPMGEIPATNRSLSGRCIQVIRVEGEYAVEEKLYYDQVQLMTQLGLMPEPATA